MDYQEFKGALQGSIATLSDLFSALDGFTGSEAFSNIVAENGGAEKLLRRELSEYFMYLAAADGEVSLAEANMISDCLCEYRTRQEIRQAAAEDKLRFSRTIPVILQKSVHVSNLLYEAVGSYNLPRCYEVALLVYMGLGEAIISADGDPDETEVQAYRSYINYMKKYVEENFKGDHNAVSADGDQ